MTCHGLRFASLFVRAACLPALLLGCTPQSGDDTDAETGETSDQMLPEGCDAWVEAGDDDQAALQGTLIDAEDGSTVCLAEGDFRFQTELTITGNGITLLGAGRDKTIMDFSELDLGANGIKITGDDVTVESFTVRDTNGDGIRADDVSNITFRDINVEWTADASLDNGAYGLYPVGCTGVTIVNSRVKGARDAGVYVGQSTNILVEDNEAVGNVAGIEIENSTGATVRRNHAHDNTAGLLIFNLPGLDVKDGKYTNAYENVLENNNVPNFGEPGTVVAQVPAGLGAMILASDYNELHNNTLTGNDSAGLVIVSYDTSVLFEPHDDDEFDKYPQGNFIHNNTFSGNGSAPDLLIMAISGDELPVPDILWDGCVDDELDNSDGALTNCLSGNGDATYFQFALCSGAQSKDIADATCEHPLLPDLPE